MNFYTDENPIIACSTGTQASTAIAIIRLSGFKSLVDLQPFFSLSLKKVKPRFSHLVNIVFKEHVFDNVLLVFFPKGKSYTGENVLELSIHGNVLNIQNILNLFSVHANFRLAHPGEFTYRALKNKKLSLSQVEGLDMLLNANSSLMLSQGLGILQGELHGQYLKLYEHFLKLKAAVEISIDFSDDIGDSESKKMLLDTFTQFMSTLDSLHLRTTGNISSLLSPEIVLVGQTNAGKSSLFNLLVKHGRSIVSPIAGTTRDYISEIISIEGTNYSLVDTAGIRESHDVIENIGIDRSFEILDRAFFKILIINPFETNPSYLDKMSHIKFDFLILSHADQPGFKERIASLNISKIKTFTIATASFNSGPMGPELKFGPMGPVDLSGSIGPQNSLGPIEPQDLAGPIEPLLKNLVGKKFKEMTANNPILLERHRSTINKIHLQAQDLYSKINKIDDFAILSSEINILSNYLSELIGIVSPEDVLNSIFANFCIGK